MNIKKLYPILVGIYPALFFYSFNKAEVFISVLIFPLLITFVISILLWYITWLFYKDINKAGVLTSCILFVSYSHVNIVKVMSRLDILPQGISYGYPTIAIIIYGFLIVFLFWYVRKHKPHRIITELISVVAILLIVMTSADIFYFEYTKAQQSFKKVEIPSKQIETKDSYPDIYYIIFDRYANSHILESEYGFDNSKFISSLKSRGFYVADKSYANYPKTLFSLASSLNMNYLNELEGVSTENGLYTDGLVYYIKNNKVIDFLRSKGYSIHHSGGSWIPTAHNKNADKNYNLYGVHEIYLTRFIDTTILEPILRSMQKTPSFIVFPTQKKRQNVFYKRDVLKDIAQQPGPKFVFSHMLIPHPAFVFDENCDPSRSIDDKNIDQAYISQLKCTNKIITAIISSILEESGSDPVIIIQSDEGPFMKKYYPHIDETPWDLVSDTALQSHIRILNAYYLPGVDNDVLYDSITPVNTFRVILNEYFDEDLELLPDKSFLPPELSNSSEYVDITDKVKFK